MSRILTFAALLAIPAAASAGTYSAKPAIAADGRVITRTASWACAATGCVTASDASRPVVVCQGLAKQVGKLDAFTVDGRALGGDELAKCNALAKAAPAPLEPALAKK